MSYFVELGAGGDDEPAHAGVAELEVDLTGGERGVRRHVDGGGGEDGHVGDEPFDAVLGQQADAVAGRNAGVNQGGGGGQRLGPVVVPAQVAVEAVALEAQGGERPEALGLPVVQFGEVAVGHATSSGAAASSRREPADVAYSARRDEASAGSRRPLADSPCLSANSPLCSLPGGDFSLRPAAREQAMPFHDRADSRRTDSLNGFLRRWRRNASHAGLAGVVLTVLVAAIVVFALCACQGIVGSGRTIGATPH